MVGQIRSPGSAAASWLKQSAGAPGDRSQDSTHCRGMWAPSEGEVAITCPPGRVWGWELLWQAAHLQIDACAHPRVKREWAISSLEQEALPAEFVLRMKGGELS